MSGFGCFSLVVLTVMLGACTQPLAEPEPLEFNSDPRILRGVWTGEDTEGSPFPLDLKACTPTQGGYQITSFFQRDSSPVVNLAGTVKASLMQGATDITAQQSPTCSGAVFAQSQDSVQTGVSDYELCGEAPTGSPPQFDLTSTYRFDTGAVYEVEAFPVTRQPSPADPNLLVRGNLVYAQGKFNTSTEPFEFTEDSHAIVQLWWSIGPGVADVPAELIASTTIEDVSSFPIEYQLEGDTEEIFARRGEYYLNVGVFSGDGGPTGEKSAVGDLTNETYTLVPSPGSAVEVEMTRLESCGSPDADGPSVP